MKKKLTQNPSIINKLPAIALLFILVDTETHGFSAEEEKWLNSDDSDVTQVNEGKLEFIIKPKNKNVLHSINQLTINKNSIENGWVGLQQCYRNLDKLPEVEIVYRYQFIKNLKLLSKTNIDNVTIKNQSIELINIKDHAEVCVSAEVRIFYQNPDLTFSLVNGPYHRQFLDGFYPYHVTLKIHYPESLLSFHSISPERQPGFNLLKKKNTLHIDSFFEGILNTEVRFKELKP